MLLSEWNVAIVVNKSLHNCTDTVRNSECAEQNAQDKADRLESCSLLQTNSADERRHRLQIGFTHNWKSARLPHARTCAAPTALPMRSQWVSMVTVNTASIHMESSTNSIAKMHKLSTGLTQTGTK